MSAVMGTVAQVRVDGCAAACTAPVKLASGAMQSLRVRFMLSEDWAGYVQTAVFLVGDQTLGVLLDQDACCVIPWEVLTAKHIGQMLYVAISGNRADGTALNSTYAAMGKVERGANVSVEQTQPPAPDLYRQMLGEMDKLRIHAADSAQRAQDAAVHTPKISEQDTWLVYDQQSKEYVDTGKSALGRDGLPGPPGGPPGPKGDPGGTVAQVYATVPTTAWVGDTAPYHADILAEGVRSDPAQLVLAGLAETATPEERAAARKASLLVTGKADGAITLTADLEKPSISLPILLALFG